MTLSERSQPARDASAAGPPCGFIGASLAPSADSAGAGRPRNATRAAQSRTRFSASIPRVTPRKSITSCEEPTSLLVVDLRVGGDDRDQVGGRDLRVEVGRASPNSASAGTWGSW